MSSIRIRRHFSCLWGSKGFSFKMEIPISKNLKICITNLKMSRMLRKFRIINRKLLKMLNLIIKSKWGKRDSSSYNSQALWSIKGKWVSLLKKQKYMNQSLKARAYLCNKLRKSLYLTRRKSKLLKNKSTTRLWEVISR